MDRARPGERVSGAAPAEVFIISPGSVSKPAAGRVSGLPPQQRDEPIPFRLDRCSRALWVTVLAVAALAGCSPAKPPAQASAQRLAASGLSDAALWGDRSQFDQATLALAERHDPGLRRADLWGRPLGWGDLDLRKVPDLGFPTEQGEGAIAINALRPFAGLPIRPMRPFVLKADAQDSARALQCLSQAIYYEAAREPVNGQRAVAQVVLNRVRHPAYPKSVCGVVYQGAARATGCQFTFTCDGSLRWAPHPALWRQVQDVARRALAGYVDKDVGSATHYHANYVMAYWAPTLVKMTQVGQHIFYRWTGPWGEPPAFTGRYLGHENDLSPELLASGGVGGVLAPERQGVPAERKITLAVAGEVRTYNVADPTAAGGQRTRVLGTLYAPRRQPTPDEVKQINDSLASMEKKIDPPAPVAAAPSTGAKPAVAGAAPTSAPSGDN
jgi:hypothetical protein